MDVVSDSQQGGDPALVDQPATVTAAMLPTMDLERTLPRQVSAGVSRGVQQLGTPNIFVDSGANQIIVADTVNRVTTNRVLMGSQKTFGDGFYVSKPGKKVSTVTDPADFIFNSNQNVFKVVISDSLDFPAVTVPAGGDITNQQARIPHNLGFVPAFQIFVKIPKPSNTYNTLFPDSYYVSVTNTLQTNDGNSVTYYFYFGVDETYLYLARGIHNFDIVDHISSATTAKYYIQQETAN